MYIPLLYSNKCLQMELRDYQKEVFELINSNDEYCFQLPCGTGKNVIISEYVNRYPENKYVIFSPSIYLANEMCKLINRPVNRIFSDKPTEEIHDVSVCVYNSWNKLEKEYDILFVDEAHHFENGAWKMESCNIKRRYLFSATLQISDYIYSHGEAVKNNYIVDFTMDIHYVDSINHDSIINIINKNKQYEHIIAYCNTKIAAVFLTSILSLYGISACCVHSGMSKKDINKNIKDFKEGNVRVLVNCYLINEGVDIKICDCALFCENRKSEVQIVQCIGRMQRLFENKTHGKFICFLEESNRSLTSIKRYLKVINNPKYFELNKINHVNLINDRKDGETDYNYTVIKKKLTKVN